MVINELYIRSPHDPNYAGPVVLHHNNIVEQILTRIKMILGTVPGSVLGSPEFGVDIERYVFSTNFNAQHIESLINQQINKYVQPIAMDYDIKCKVEFGRATEEEDYDVINVFINVHKTIGFSIN